MVIHVGSHSQETCIHLSKDNLRTKDSVSRSLEKGQGAGKKKGIFDV